MFLPRRLFEKRLREFLNEDLGQGDITTALVVPEGSVSEAKVTAKESGVAAGIEEATILSESLGLKVKVSAADGEKIEKEQVLMRITGDTRTILSVERTLLNIISRMSGIATATRRITEKLEKAGLKTTVACTRKTAPGLLYFDKKAVVIGGGDPHRLHLDDLILIKDNHITVAGSVEKALKAAKKGASFSKKIEVEVTEPEDAVAAAKAEADIIMLDNFTPREITRTIEALKRTKLYGRAIIEASGGITYQNVLAFARTGVDVVSLGEITHSPRAFNASLNLVKTVAHSSIASAH
jgi:nicotinate-nucleotide pyrophosphorylase (carboxylating)